MLAAPPMTTGVDGIRVYGLPGPRLVEVLQKYKNACLSRSSYLPRPAPRMGLSRERF